MARELTDGNTAIVRGALDAGCDFFAGYPITPASSILTMLMRELPRRGGIAVQGEDEIASIGMCIGAAMTGARAMTATSGPGLSLYGENVGLAIMGEVPLVIVDVQRLGPATGGATTASQGDVQFVRWGTAGGYPIIALAPWSVASCYRLTARAFALAERFRVPVFVLTDKELSLTRNTVDAAEFVLPDAVGPGDETPRYGGQGIVRFTGSTHDERGFITKDPATVGALNAHLVAKVEDHRDEIEMVVVDADPGAATLLVAYGITAGAARVAARRLRAAGRPVSVAVVESLWPVPETALTAAWERAERIVVAELNHGLYRREIERLAGGRPVVGVTRVDGELITPEQIIEAAA